MTEPGTQKVSNNSSMINWMGDPFLEEFLTKGMSSTHQGGEGAAFCVYADFSVPVHF